LRPYTHVTLERSATAHLALLQPVFLHASEFNSSLRRAKRRFSCAFFACAGLQ